MRITPLDIQSHRFRSAFKGADREEVEAFLRAVAEDYEALLRENHAQRDAIERLEARIEELSLNEALLKETLVTAQNLGDELRLTARKEAEVTVSEAEIKAEKILDAAHRRAARLHEEIREMRGLRTRLASALRTSLETHMALVDALCEDPERDEAVLEATYLESGAESETGTDAAPALRRAPPAAAAPPTSAAGAQPAPAQEPTWDASRSQSTATRKASGSSST